MSNSILWAGERWGWGGGGIETYHVSSAEFAYKEVKVKRKGACVRAYMRNGQVQSNKQRCSAHYIYRKVALTKVFAYLPKRLLLKERISRILEAILGIVFKIFPGCA